MNNTENMSVQKESAANAALNIGTADSASIVDLNQDESLGKKRIFAVVLMVVAALLIVVSCFFLFESFNDDFDTNAATHQTTQQDAAGQDGDASASPRDADTSKVADDTGVSAPADTDVTQDASQGTSTGSQNGSDAGSSSESTSDDTNSDPANEAVAPPSNSGVITVSVVISSAVVGNPVSMSQTVTLNQGATVYDALLATGVSVNANSSNMGIYVAAIGGLAEKQHGGTSGWTYYVNGVWADMSCGYWILNDGDNIYWEYVADGKKW